MKLTNLEAEHIVRGRIEDGEDFTDRYSGQKRRAESFVIRWFPMDEEEDRYIDVSVRGRRVTKAGDIHKADTYAYSLFSRVADEYVLRGANTQGLVPEAIVNAWLAKH